MHSQFLLLFCLSPVLYQPHAQCPWYKSHPSICTYSASVIRPFVGLKYRELSPNLSPRGIPTTFHRLGNLRKCVVDELPHHLRCQPSFPPASNHPPSPGRLLELVSDVATGTGVDRHGSRDSSPAVVRWMVRFLSSETKVRPSPNSLCG